MTSRANPWVFAPAALALVVFAAYVVLWNRGAAEMRKAVASWTEDIRSRGDEAGYKSLKAEGFPFLLRGVVDEVTLAGESWAWSAPRLFIDVSPFAGKRAILSVREPHFLTLGGTKLRIDAPDGRASIAGDAGRGWLLDVESGPAKIERLDGRGSVSARSFLLSAAPNAANAQRIFFGVDARGIAAQAAGAPLDVEAVELAFAIEGPVGVRSLRDWRDGGGRLDIQRARLATGSAHATFAGRLVLDENGFPAGSLNAEIANPAPIVEALSAAGLVSGSGAAKTAAALTLAAIAGGGRINAPLRLEEGAAAVASVRLGALPRLLRNEAPQP